MSSLKKAFTVNNLVILVGAAVFAFALFTPTKFRTVCPQGLTSDPIPGGSCSLFVDANTDTLCDYLYQTDVPLSPTFEFKFLTEAVIFSLLLLTSIIALFAKEEKIRLGRYCLLGFSFFYFGILLAKKTCPIGTLQALFILKEAIVLKFPIFLIFLLPIVVALLAGRVFCGWLCPLGACQELIHRISKRLGTKTLKVSQKWRGLLKTIPFLILTVTIAAALTSQQILFCRFEPFGYLFGRTRNLVPLLLLVGLFLLLPFFFQPFCQYVCPYGAVLRLLSRYSIFRLKINRRKCAQCKLCEKVCPVEAIKNQKIDFPGCILCKDCQRRCPKKSISFSKA